VVIVAVIYLANSGYQEGRTYFYSLPELFALKDAAYGVRLQVAGIVNASSIKRRAGIVEFVVGQPPQTLHIRYVGKDPPNTLIEGAEALATRTLGRDGIFVAEGLLVKPASREEHAGMVVIASHRYALWISVSISVDVIISTSSD
jgi:cytochrome c-type biogenesis protein CcmE